MNGISLKDSIQQFGFKTGFGFWFRWSFRDPVQQWWWLNISHRPYCPEHGWYCDDIRGSGSTYWFKPLPCKSEKIYNKEDILAHWEKMHKELEGSYY
jgi:hypothetical protein